MSPAEIREYLKLLLLERLEARSRGLAGCPTYTSDLEEEIADCKRAYVTAAVVEIACLRAQLSGPQVG